jgi:hypothetical protein
VAVVPIDSPCYCEHIDTQFYNIIPSHLSQSPINTHFFKKNNPFLKKKLKMTPPHPLEWQWLVNFGTNRKPVTFWIDCHPLCIATYTSFVEISNKHTFSQKKTQPKSKNLPKLPPQPQKWQSPADFGTIRKPLLRRIH